MSPTAIQAPDQEAAAAPRRPGLAVLTLGLDPLLLLAAVGLGVCSLVAIAGATANDIPGDPHYYVDRQAAYLGMGVVLALLISRMDYSRLRELKYGLYGVLIASILAVYAVGSVAKGAKRSFQLPFFSFQPSELGKVLLILALAAFLVDRARALGDRGTTVRTLALALVPALLVIKQPDLGSGLVYLAATGALLFFAGTRWTHFATIAATIVAVSVLALVAAPAAGVHVLKPYQVDRLTAFLHPTSNPRDEGWQQIQSRIAIGSGEKTGRGDRATQTKLDFLPEHHTDFIFAVVGERYGFVGAAVVLALYALLVWRSLRILTLAKNLYGALVAGGIVAALLFQIVVNAGMTIGIMPITGVPLPLMSYGGSSVLTTFIAIGLLLSIHAQGRMATAIKGRGFAF